MWKIHCFKLGGFAGGGWGWGEYGAGSGGSIEVAMLRDCP